MRLSFSVDKARIHQARRTQSGARFAVASSSLCSPCTVFPAQAMYRGWGLDLAASVGRPVLDGCKQGCRTDSEGPVLPVPVLVFVPPECEITVKPVVKNYQELLGVIRTVLQ